MSSVSRPKPTDVVLVGDALSVGLAAEAFASYGCAVTAYRLGERSRPGKWTAVWLGNGEVPANAALVYGETIARELWELSSSNLELARRALIAWGVARWDHEVAWFASNERERALLEASARRHHGRVRGGTLWTDGPWCETGGAHFEAVLTEPAFSFDAVDLETALEARAADRGAPLLPISRLREIRRVGPLDSVVVVERQGRTEEKMASLVLFLDDNLPEKIFPSLSEKWIPVTLSSFTYRKASDEPFSLAVFHGGADFAVGSPSEVRLGSFRNLYQDKAVGAQTQADHATWQGVSRFFGGLHWIDPEGPFETHLSVESLTCDGLPLVGALPDSPGVYVVGGFAARTPNFLFAVLEALVSGILGGGGFERLKLFSTKRFV